ncbi:hypothetical protein [Massilia niastensis]|uniref:hypothetical protein n=1 Tax=Massilia niastensis TaxID=544911 RepID=UPI0012EB8FF3|nr:hypothetical protein [Massilia niastensis]
MRRSQVRELKQAVSTHGDAAAMHELLNRSVRFGHKRLALLRCLQAERMGIAVDGAILSYCRRVADAMAPDALQDIMRRAAG